MSQENPFIFLIDTLFSIYIAIMLLRFILQQVGADFFLRIKIQDSSLRIGGIGYIHRC